MSDKKDPRVSFCPAIVPSMLVVQRDGFVRFKAGTQYVAEIRKDLNGVYRFKTKDGAGKWREHFSRAAFKSIRDAKKELCKWL